MRSSNTWKSPSANHTQKFNYHQQPLHFKIADFFIRVPIEYGRARSALLCTTHTCNKEIHAFIYALLKRHKRIKFYQYRFALYLYMFLPWFYLVELTYCVFMHRDLLVFFQKTCSFINSLRIGINLPVFMRLSIILLTLQKCMCILIYMFSLLPL